MRKYYHGEFINYTRKFFFSEDGHPAVRSLCARPEGGFYAACDSGLYTISGGILSKLGDFDGRSVARVRAFGGRVFAASGNSVYELRSDKICSEYSFGENAVDMSLSADGVLWVVTERALYRQSDKSFLPLTSIPGEIRSVDAFIDEQVYAGTNCGLLALTGKRYHWSELTGEWSGLVSDDVKCVRFDSLGFIWAATAKGVSVYDGKNCWKSPVSVKNLPSGDIRDMAFGEDGAKYFACDFGIAVLKNGKLSYYTYKRWLPHPSVTAVAVSKSGEICAATPEGISVLTPEAFTLESKADYYDELCERYFIRKDGYAASRDLAIEGDMDSGRTVSGDNDGLYTGLYAAAQSFRYAATGSPDALLKARRSIKALMKLTDICGDGGFVARAIRYPDEPDYKTGERSEWRLTESGEEWKGETSSDEITGHMYAYSVYFDFCADDGEKDEITLRVRRITDHILSHGMKMYDVDGKPTTWANWSPESLNGDNKWIFERGINSIEIMSFLITAHHITGDEKYYKAFKSLAAEHHYALNAMKYKIEDGHITHIDDQLAFNCIYPLLKYTNEPDLKSIIMMGLYDHRRYEKVEHTPLWDIVFGHLTGEICDIDSTAQTLAEMPLDTVLWQSFNSRIPNLEWDTEQEKYGNPPQLKEPLPFTVRPLYQGDANPFICDAGEDDFMKATETSQGLFWSPSRKNYKGLRALCPVFYLQPYWAARYFGLIGD